MLLTVLHGIAMIPLSLAGKATNVILAGDPCQLGPVSLVSFSVLYRALRISTHQSLLSRA